MNAFLANYIIMNKYIQFIHIYILRIITVSQQSLHGQLPRILFIEIPYVAPDNVMEQILSSLKFHIGFK